MKNPVKTYLRIADYIEQENNNCRRDVRIHICRGDGFLFATSDQLKHSQDRIQRMLYRITRELYKAGIDPQNLFPQGDNWYWDVQSERIMFRNPKGGIWPDVESLLKHILDSWDQ